MYEQAFAATYVNIHAKDYTPTTVRAAQAPSAGAEQRPRARALEGHLLCRSAPLSRWCFLKPPQSTATFVVLRRSQPAVCRGGARLLNKRRF